LCKLVTQVPDDDAVAKNTRGKPLVLSRVRWVKSTLVAEVTYLTWAADGLLRHVVYEGLREDKAARDVGRR
jgi:ATP-dependent DNA ligase